MPGHRLYCPSSQQPIASQRTLCTDVPAATTLSNTTARGRYPKVQRSTGPEKNHPVSPP